MTYKGSCHCGRIAFHCASFSEAADPAGKPMAAVNARCLEDIDLSALKVVAFDGKSL